LSDLVSYNDKHNEANGENKQRRRQQQLLLELPALKGQRTIQKSTNCERGSGEIF